MGFFINWSEMHIHIPVFSKQILENFTPIRVAYTNLGQILCMEGEIKEMDVNFIKALFYSSNK